MTRLQSKRDLVESIELELIVERKKAAFGSWYEMFVRSQSKTPGQHSTFREAEHRLPDIKAMGFDVLYLAPIYPIGISGRKGKDNSLICRPEDPGCPWAVGSDAGGHTAVEPLLGTLTDFDHFQKEAGKNGLEIALDFAVQCSPDHPWVKKHPEWFFQRPDGSVKFAENPPMKYEDICQINFDCPTWESLWRELRDSILFWIKRGVKIFRVDNPHTKAFTFWEWLIKEIRSDYPDVIFLSEALTRPKPMKLLSKLGFSQSYTYFIWRNSKHEVMEYLSELSQSPMKDYFRPNLFVNTPDNIHPYLQNGGQPAFKIRLALAGTLSPSYGIYSGYELCENEAIPGTEEYKNSEKFEISPRDWNKPGHIKDYIAKINAIRKENSALHHIGNLHFFDIQNDQMVAFGKIETDFSNIILVVANLDPFHAQAGNLRLSLDKLGLPWSGKVELRDLITGQNYVWGEHNFVSLDPYHEPVHILKVERRYS
jgi:starch synthase (maltosyl-transferring)